MNNKNKNGDWGLGGVGQMNVADNKHGSVSIYTDFATYEYWITFHPKPKEIFLYPASLPPPPSLSLPLGFMKFILYHNDYYCHRCAFKSHHVVNSIELKLLV